MHIRNHSYWVYSISPDHPLPLDFPLMLLSKCQSKGCLVSNKSQYKINLYIEHKLYGVIIRIILSVILLQFNYKSIVYKASSKAISYQLHIG